MGEQAPISLGADSEGAATTSAWEISWFLLFLYHPHLPVPLTAQVFNESFFDGDSTAPGVSQSPSRVSLTQLGGPEATRWCALGNGLQNLPFFLLFLPSLPLWAPLLAQALPNPRFFPRISGHRTHILLLSCFIHISLWLQLQSSG